MENESPQTTEGPGEPDREGMGVEGDGPQVHTGPGEHPGGEGERSDRDIGGPTSPDSEPEEDVEGGGPSVSPGSGFEAHGESGESEEFEQDS
jgi:hypothetical protein